MGRTIMQNAKCKVQNGRWSRLLVLHFAFCILHFGAAGCIKPPPPPKQVDYSLIEPMAKVVQEINANNTKIPSLLTRLYFEADIVDEKKQKHTVNGDGVLLYRQNQEMLLRGTKPGIGTVFEAGSNAGEYWLKVVPQTDTMWWGHYANLGKPCAQEIPVNPGALLQVLGVGAINTDFFQSPSPVIRFNNDQDAYMIIWTVPLTDRFAAQREVWYDRQTKLPRLVILFDEDGRIILRANLSEHKRVAAEQGKDPAGGPMMATKFNCYFPKTKSRMTLDLKDPALVKGDAPNARAFVRPPEDRAGVGRVIQLDKDCE